MLPDFITHPPAIARLLAEGGTARLCDDLAAGQTLHAIASRIGTTRGVLVRYISTVAPEDQAAIRAADAQGVAAMVEESKDIADDMADEMRRPRTVITKDGTPAEIEPPAQAVLTAAKMQIDVRQWIAERKDKENWGGKANTEITVNLANIHLDVLRKRTSQPSQPIAVLESVTPLTLDNFL